MACHIAACGIQEQDIQACLNRHSSSMEMVYLANTLVCRCHIEVHVYTVLYLYTIRTSVECSLISTVSHALQIP